MTAVSTLRHGKLRLRCVDDFSRPAERESVSECFLLCFKLHFSIWFILPEEVTNAKIAGSLETWPSVCFASCFYWELGEWRKARGANILGACMCVAQLLAWVHLHLGVLLCGWQKWLCLSQSFPTLPRERNVLYSFIGNFKHDAIYLDCIYPKVSPLPPLKTFLHPLLNFKSSL